MNTTALQAPGKGSVWRPLGKREVLPDLPESSWSVLTEMFAEYGEILGGGMVPGDRRCSAIGMRRGDCSQEHVAGSRYCHYHDLVQRGVITDFNRGSSTGVLEPVSPRERYPVWPLPKSGYVLLAEEAVAA